MGSISNQKAKNYIKQVFCGRKIDRILFVHPPDVTSDSFNLEVAKRGGYYNFPPYGLGVLAKKVKMHGLKAEIVGLHNNILQHARNANIDEEFDYDLVWQNKLSQDFYRFQPDLVAVTCLFSMTHASFVNVCNYIKTLIPKWLGENVKIPIAIGGVHITQFWDDVLDDLPSVEFAFLRESESTLLRFIDTINNDLPIDSLRQVVINTPEKRLTFLKKNIPSGEEINIIPDFNLINISDYSKYGRMGSFDWTQKTDTKMASVLSNRGCRANCTFCNVRFINGVGVRTRDIDSVIDELQLLRDEHDIRHITWLDDDLLYNTKRAVDLFNKMEQKNIGITWDAMNGVIAASCTDEVISAAAASGCLALNIGMESGNGVIQSKIKKPGNSRTFLKAAEVLIKYDSINARVFLMLGFPGETHRMISDTITLALEMNLDWYSITILQPWLTTSIYETIAEQGLIEKRRQPLDGRYSSGPFGRQKSVEVGNSIHFHNFFECFRGSFLDQVPSKDNLLDLWFYMNYFLNFHKLFHENRHQKISQQLKFLTHLCRIIAPGNGFGLYFKGLLEYKLENKASTNTIGILKDILETSLFWSQVFDDLGLSLNDLENNDFPIKKDAKTELSLSHIEPGWVKRKKTHG